MVMTIFILVVEHDLRWFRSGPRLNIKTVLSTYGDFHVKDKTAVRTSNMGIAIPCKTVFLIETAPRLFVIQRTYTQVLLYRHRREMLSVLTVGRHYAASLCVAAGSFYLYYSLIGTSDRLWCKLNKLSVTTICEIPTAILNNVVWSHNAHTSFLIAN